MTIRRPQRNSLGLDVGALLTAATTGYTAAEHILADPYLPEVSRQVVRLHELEQKKAVPGRPAPAPVKGIGLRRIAGPLRLYVKVRERPWIGWAIVAGVLGVPFLLGRASKR